MRVKCLHGFYIFTETTAGQISDFINKTGLEIEPKDDYYTFSALKDAPNFSLKGGKLLGFNAPHTFSGNPWEVFKANGVVYDIETGLLKLKTAITTQSKVSPAGNYWFSNGLLQAGCTTQFNKRVIDFDAWYSRARGTWIYTEVTSE